MMRSLSAQRSSRSDGDDRDRGAILILALLFIVAVSLIVTALATWATNDLRNTKTFTNVESLHSDASGMMKLSVQYVRYNPIIEANQAANVASPVTACWGGTVPANLPKLTGGYQVAVWCSTVWNPSSSNTRVVTFYACEAFTAASVPVPASVCTSPGETLLTEVVTFDDYPNGQTSAPNQTLCSVLCGQGETVNSSKWGSPTVDIVGITPASASFIEEPSPTNVNVATTAEVQILGGSGLPISGDTVTLTALSPGTLSSTSTLSVPTNTSGIAYFTNIVPSNAGTLTLSATDLTVSATSTAFNVGKGANTITLSAVPTNPQSGTNVTVTATATSLDPVTVSSSTPGVCTASGTSSTIGLISVGTCTLTFTDSGNANFLSATNSMQFSVVAPLPAQIVMSTGASSVSASGVTNDSLTLTLQSSSGASTVSNGTTTVTLSQTGSGYFSSSNGSASNTSNVTFANGVGSVTVYFGDTVAESVGVTASNSALTAANTTINVVAGAANKVGVTANSPVLANNLTNDAVTLVIEDQFGNSVSPAGPTTLNLLSSGSGFFAAATSSSTAITSVTLPAGTGQKIVYFADRAAQTATLSVTGPGGLAGSTFVTVSAASASQVILSVGSGTSTVSSSSNDSVGIKLEDQFGNAVSPSSATAFTLASSGSGYFTASNGGTTKITSATIGAGGSSTTVYFGDTTAQIANLTVSSTGLTPGTSQITVSNALASQVGVTAGTSTLTATNVGTDSVTLTLEDSGGNPVTALSAVTLTLGDSGSGFYSATLNSGTAITTAIIPSGSSSVKVYFGDKVAEGTTLQASGPYSGSLSVMVAAGAPSQVVMAVNPTPNHSNSTNTQVSVQAEDQFGNATTTAPSSSYTITTNNGNGFFATSTGIRSFNASSSLPFTLTGGQTTLYFGDNSRNDNPTIQIFDAGNRLVASTGVNVQ
jgi:hypothetical protein